MVQDEIDEKIDKSFPVFQLASSLNHIPPEISFLILSYLSVLDYFPLKLAGSRRITESVRALCHQLQFTKYVKLIEAEYYRRYGSRCSALVVAAKRGQTGLFAILLKKIPPPPYSDLWKRLYIYWF